VASAHDVAAYILEKQGEMTTMKLQKLVFYCQSWHLFWDEKPLFEDRIEAWANGPVVPALYDLHRGKFTVSEWPQGDLRNLQEEEQGTVKAVLGYYGDKTSQWLSDLTHQEQPWREAREGLDPGWRSNREITHAAMAEYCSSL